MPKGSNQKFKLYRLAQIMLNKTDDEQLYNDAGNHENSGRI